MTKISPISTSELMQDLKETLENIGLCATALVIGVSDYSGGLTQERLIDNRQILTTITDEIITRYAPNPKPTGKEVNHDVPDQVQKTGSKGENSRE